MKRTPAIEAVGELLRVQTMRIQVTEDVAYTVKGPCRLALLQDAIAVGNALSGTSSVPGSRPPLATEALDLWLEINYTTHYVARHLGLQRRDPGNGSPTPWVGRLLRQCVAHAQARAFEKVVATLERKATDWRLRIDGMLVKPEATQRGVRGVACDECQQSWVQEVRDREVYRVPAILLVTRGDLRWLVCQACGWNEPAVAPGDELVHKTSSGQEQP